ncbi:MAG: hypothetical protein HYX40_00400 [Sphingobacteriales bacterium]|nr:hypothetical protein [Sphingobacteriales bacterium]
MNSMEFNLLSDAEKLEWLWDKSNLINEVPHENYRFINYRVEEFYVRVKYHPDTDTISDIEAMDEI